MNVLVQPEVVTYDAGELALEVAFGSGTTPSDKAAKSRFRHVKREEVLQHTQKILLEPSIISFEHEELSVEIAFTTITEVPSDREKKERFSSTNEQMVLAQLTRKASCPKTRVLSCGANELTVEVALTGGTVTDGTTVSDAEKKTNIRASNPRGVLDQVLRRPVLPTPEIATYQRDELTCEVAFLIDTGNASDRNQKENSAAVHPQHVLEQLGNTRTLPNPSVNSYLAEELSIDIAFTNGTEIISDRNAKERFARVHERMVLERLAGKPPHPLRQPAVTTHESSELLPDIAQTETTVS